MNATNSGPQAALKLESEAFDDLTAASESSLKFWDNPLDDEDWNSTIACEGASR